jgi:hypothetical protein
LEKNFMKLRISALILALTALAVVLSTRPGRAQVEGLAPAGSLQQQAETRFNTLKVDLWPEYDQPSVLVIYHITLDPNVTLPVDLEINIPAAAGEPNALAAGLTDEATALQNVDYERQVNGEWATLSFTASMPIVRVEYYDPSLVKQGASRSFVYTWPGDYALGKLIVEVQQPAGARDMSLDPNLGNSVLDNDGLLYYRADLGSRQAGEQQTISMVYQKDTDTLSIENVRVEPSDPIIPSESGFPTFNSALPWLLGVLGVVLIAGGGLWYWQSGKNRERTAPARRRRRPAAEREPAPAEGHVYCHQCGKRAAANDRFCRTCGTKLRVE